MHFGLTDKAAGYLVAVDLFLLGDMTVFDS